VQAADRQLADIVKPQPAARKPQQPTTALYSKASDDDKDGDDVVVVGKTLLIHRKEDEEEEKEEEGGGGDGVANADAKAEIANPQFPAQRQRRPNSGTWFYELIDDDNIDANFGSSNNNSGGTQQAPQSLPPDDGNAGSRELRMLNEAVSDFYTTPGDRRRNRERGLGPQRDMNIIAMFQSSRRRRRRRGSSAQRAAAGEKGAENLGKG